jgi:tetratricopeptide (TPR) repeat protein
LQCAATYLAVAEYDRARSMADSAAAAFRSLGDEFPADPAAFRGLAESITLQGHLDLLAAKYREALGRYQEAARIGETAAGIDPNDSEAQLVLADAYLATAMFLGNSDPQGAGEYNRRVMTIAEQLLAKPSAGYRARQLMFTVLVNSAAASIARGKFEPAYALLESAHTILPAFDGLRPPNAHAAQMLAMSRAEFDVHYGAYLVRRGKKEEGMKSVREGLGGADRLLAAQPKSFPHRIRKLQLQLIAAEASIRVGKSRDAESLFGEIDRGREQLLKDMPQMTWLSDFGAPQRSVLLVELAREGRSEGMEAGFEKIMRQADSRGQLSVRYNAACAFSLLSRSGPAGDRERFARRAIELLKELLTAGYFRSPQTNDHLDDDTDLDPLRERPDFREFFARAKAQRPKK